MKKFVFWWLKEVLTVLVISKKYIGEFFSITNFNELDALTIDLEEIEKQYDVIVTDVMVGKKAMS